MFVCLFVCLPALSRFAFGGIKVSEFGRTVDLLQQDGDFRSLAMAAKINIDEVVARNLKRQ